MGSGAHMVDCIRLAYRGDRYVVVRSSEAQTCDVFRLNERDVFDRFIGAISYSQNDRKVATEALSLVRWYSEKNIDVDELFKLLEIDTHKECSQCG